MALSINTHLYICIYINIHKNKRIYNKAVGYYSLYLIQRYIDPVDNLKLKANYKAFKSISIRYRNLRHDAQLNRLYNKAVSDKIHSIYVLLKQTDPVNDIKLKAH
jgi:hypothetical protein